MFYKFKRQWTHYSLETSILVLFFSFINNSSCSQIQINWKSKDTVGLQYVSALPFQPQAMDVLLFYNKLKYNCSNELSQGDL